MIVYVATISLILNAFSTGFIYYQARQFEKLAKRPESVELKEFLFDLLSGDGLIQVKRIATSDVVLRSPRGTR